MEFFNLASDGTILEEPSFLDQQEIVIGYRSGRLMCRKTFDCACAVCLPYKQELSLTNDNFTCMCGQCE